MGLSGANFRAVPSLMRSKDSSVVRRFCMTKGGEDDDDDGDDDDDEEELKGPSIRFVSRLPLLVESNILPFSSEV